MCLSFFAFKRKKNLTPHITRTAQDRLASSQQQTKVNIAGLIAPQSSVLTKTLKSPHGTFADNTLVGNGVDEIDGLQNFPEASAMKRKSSVKRTFQALFLRQDKEPNALQPSVLTKTETSPRDNMVDKHLLERSMAEMAIIPDDSEKGTRKIKMPIDKVAEVLLQENGNGEIKINSDGAMNASRNSASGGQNSKQAASAKGDYNEKNYSESSCSAALTVELINKVGNVMNCMMSGGEPRAPQSIERSATKDKALLGISVCKHCSRNFKNDRLMKHEEVCEKVTAKKRCAFESSKQRMVGTESEKFNQKKAVKPPVVVAEHCTPVQQQSGEKKSNWRVKHEELVTALRTSREIQMVVKKGGKITDLPPPPPMRNPDYIQCPYCERRFCQRAAERHIKFCATQKRKEPKAKNVTGSVTKKTQVKTPGKVVAGKGGATL